MEKNIKNAFITSIEKPESDLGEKIWQKVYLRIKRRTQIKFLIFSAICLSSFTAFVFAFVSLMDKFASSGFYQYVSVAFSDSKELALYWKDFGVTIIDSVPFISIVWSLLFVFMFLFSLRYAIKQFTKNGLVFNKFSKLSF